MSKDVTVTVYQKIEHTASDAQDTPLDDLVISLV